MRRKVYVSGPITDGGIVKDMDVVRQNVKVAAEAATKLAHAGFAPLCPHLTVEQEEITGEQLDHETWMEIDEPWVLASDVVVRLPGRSAGADRECEIARQAGIPVTSLDELLDATFFLGGADPDAGLPRIIGLSGYARSGKDSVGAVLAPHGYTPVSFASALKAIATEIGWGGSKATGGACPCCGVLGGRRLLQVLGTEGCRAHLGEDVWVRALERQLRPGSRYVVTDCRFAEEATAVRRWGGEVWRIVRPGTSSDGHASEEGVDAIEPDRVVDNAGTLGDLRVRVESLLGVGTMEGS